MRKFLIGCRILQLLRNAEWADKQKIEQRRRERRGENRISQPDLRCKTSPPKWKMQSEAKRQNGLIEKIVPLGGLKEIFSVIELKSIFLIYLYWARGEEARAGLLPNAFLKIYSIL